MIRYKLHVIAALLFINFTANCIFYKTQPRWNEDLNLIEIEKNLINCKINDVVKCLDKCETKQDSVYLVSLSNGLLAIFKSRGHLANLAEVAAYRAYKFLNQRLVPPTVLRTINNMEGSLQFFVTPSLDEKQTNFDFLDSKTKSDFLLFSFIFGNFDWTTLGKNMIIQSNANKLYLAAIDNAKIGLIQKAKYGGIPFFKGAKYTSNIKENVENQFPFHEAKDFNDQSDNKLKLSYNYLKLFLEPFCWIESYVIYKNHIWLQPSSKIFGVSFTNIYYKSTLEYYKRLTKKILKKIWNISDYYNNNVEYFDELFDDILDRRDQVLKASENGTVIYDL